MLARFPIDEYPSRPPLPTEVRLHTAPNGSRPTTCIVFCITFTIVTIVTVALQQKEKHPRNVTTHHPSPVHSKNEDTGAGIEIEQPPVQTVDFKIDHRRLQCLREQDANPHWETFDMSLRKCAHTYCVQGQTVDEAMRRCTKEKQQR